MGLKLSLYCVGTIRNTRFRRTLVGLKLSLYCVGTIRNTRFRRTLVGLKQLNRQNGPLFLVFQKDPCGIEASSRSSESITELGFQKDPCGIEAPAGLTAQSYRSFQKDPCGIEAKRKTAIGKLLTTVSEGPLWD